MTGRKDDRGKLRYTIIDPIVLREVARALTCGAEKYNEPLGARNWVGVDNWRHRYGDALLRHFEDWRSGSELDPDGTGLRSLAQVIVNAHHLLSNELRGMPDAQGGNVSDVGAARPFQVGDRVVVKTTGRAGVVTAVDRQSVEVRLGGAFAWFCFPDLRHADAPADGGEG